VKRIIAPPPNDTITATTPSSWEAGSNHFAGGAMSDAEVYYTRAGHGQARIKRSYPGNSLGSITYKSNPKHNKRNTMAEHTATVRDAPA
jgi:hypothetical protein